MSESDDQHATKDESEPKAKEAKEPRGEGSGGEAPHDEAAAEQRAPEEGEEAAAEAAPEPKKTGEKKKRKKKEPPKSTFSWTYLATGVGIAVVVWFAYTQFARKGMRPPGKGVQVEALASATRQPWIDRGYVELVPPLRAPARVKGYESIEIWVKFPAEGRITAKYNAEQKRHVLVYPPGLIADRLEVMGEDRAVVDVRGTELGAGGLEMFHVYRRIGSGMKGLVWKRGDPDQQQEATRALLDMMRLQEHSNEREIRAAKANNDCGGCHQHEKPERRKPQAGQPNRAGDAAGFFEPQTVLADRMPVEAHRPRETNIDDPFIHFVCMDEAGEEKPAAFHTKENGTKWPMCQDGTVPIGILDTKAALAANDAHAKRLCESRKVLYDHMDEAARKAFESAFVTCGLVKGEEVKAEEEEGG